MENMTINDILTATGGTLLCGDPNFKIDRISTNSMQMGPNTLFVPIIGERVDAHVFISNALKNGGACLTQEHDHAKGNAPYIKVPNTGYIFDSLVMAHELSHLRNTGKKETYVRYYLTETIAYTEELLLLNDLKESHKEEMNVYILMIFIIFLIILIYVYRYHWT